MRIPLCAAFILLSTAVIPLCANGASFDVDQISVTGPENVYPGDFIQVSARVSFDSTGEVTFPGGDTLHLSSGLSDPGWQYTLTVDNYPVQTFHREAETVFINGYYLEYSQGRSEYLSVQVSGIIPAEVPDGMIHALTVTQYDGYGNVRGNGISTIPVLVDTNYEYLNPEKTPVPESAVPMPTDSSFSGFVIVMAIASAFAAIFRSKKED